jgi:hypothetical protein
VQDAAVLAALHAAHALAQLDAHDDDLHRREQLADVLDRRREPRVQISALITRVEEQTVQRGRQADDGADKGAQQRRVGELPGYREDGLGAWAEGIVPGECFEVSFLLERVGGAHDTVREERGVFVDDAVWAALDIIVSIFLRLATFIILLSLFFLLGRIFIARFQEARTQGECERVANHGVDQEIRFRAVESIGCRITANENDIENLGLLERFDEEEG